MELAVKGNLSVVAPKGKCLIAARVRAPLRRRGPPRGLRWAPRVLDGHTIILTLAADGSIRAKCTLVHQAS